MEKQTKWWWREKERKNSIWRSVDKILFISARKKQKRTITLQWTALERAAEERNFNINYFEFQSYVNALTVLLVWMHKHKIPSSHFWILLLLLFRFIDLIHLSISISELNIYSDFQFTRTFSLADFIFHCCCSCFFPSVVCICGTRT